MQIVLLDNDGEKRVIRVETPWAELAADYSDIVSAYAKVRMPGFRPGKVPRSLIEQRFQTQILDDLSHRAAQRLGREALRETGAVSAGPVEIVDIECAQGKPFLFTARFWPMPEFELPDLGSLAIRDDDSDPRDIISQRLLDKVSFTIPDEFVREELGPDDSGSSSENAAWKAAEERVRLLLILKRIAKQEGIEVTKTDVEKRIKDKALEFGTDPDSLKDELQKGGGMARLQDVLLAEDTLNFLMELKQQ